MGADAQSYWYAWMTTKENRRLFEPLPPREVYYCFVDAHPSSSNEELKASVEALKAQSYKKWSAVYFVDSDRA